MNFLKAAAISLFLILIAAHTTNAQLSKLDAHYPGGQEQFWNDFKEHFSFPSSTVKARTYGTALIKLTLNSDGVPARVLFLNQLDIDLIKSITRSFTKISHNWSVFPAESELYIGVVFSYDSDYTLEIDIDKSAITKEIAEFVFIIKAPDSNSINYKKNYAHLVKSAKKAYKKSDFKIAMQAYSKLISIDPYQLEYYQRRVELEAFSGSKRYACTDIKVMKDMLNYKGRIPLHGCH